MFESIVGYVLEGLCFLVCIIHSIIYHKTSKGLSIKVDETTKDLSSKVDEVCAICGNGHSPSSPCFLSDKQVYLLSQFIESLLESEVNGSSK